jgi:hypothetical protein
MEVPERGKPETTTMGCFLAGDFLEEKSLSIERVESREQRVESREQRV